jgi:N-alpha-acetyltransferase 30
VPAIALYTSLGFVPEKRLHRFYLNGKDAFRLVLPLSGAGAKDVAAIPAKHLSPSSSSSSSHGREDDDDEVYHEAEPGSEGEDSAEDTAKFMQLRRRVAALRACRMITVWPSEDDEDRVSGR